MIAGSRTSGNAALDASPATKATLQRAVLSVLAEELKDTGLRADSESPHGRLFERVLERLTTGLQNSTDRARGVVANDLVSGCSLASSSHL